MAIADLDSQRTGAGPATIGVLPHRPRGGRPGQRRVRSPGPHGRPGRHRHARPHQLPRHRCSRRCSTSTRSTRSRPATSSSPTIPYKTAGQLLDVTVLVPAWRNGQIIALFGSTIHHTDVGGYGIGAGGRDVFEEGLWIPICKLMKRRRTQRRRLEVHPLERPPARSHGRRSPRPDGVRRGRGPTAQHLV